MDSSYTRWRCDRCNEEQIHEYNEQPRNWYAVQFTMPPRAVFEGERKSLCLKCADAFAAFMVGEILAIEQTAAIAKETADERESVSA